MKYKVLAGLAAAGVLVISGAAFAGSDAAPKFAAAKKQTPQFQQGERPEMPPMMSRDNRMPPPPGAHSRDKRPPELQGKRPPKPPRSGDRRPPEFRNSNINNNTK